MPSRPGASDHLSGECSLEPPTSVAAIFFIEGVTEIVVFVQFRSLPGAGWALFDGIVTLILAYMIWRPFPSSASWAIGTLLGANLIVSGFTRLMYSVEARKTLKAIA